MIVLYGLSEGSDAVLDEYKEHCKDPKTMHMYILGWWLPHLDRLRQQGKLHTGKKQIKVDGIDAEYEGELDEAENCLGHGTAITRYGKYEGTWLNDQLNGVCKCTAHHPQNIYSHIHCR